MAGPTGLEPATSGLTGRRSNRLNYDPAVTRRPAWDWAPRPSRSGGACYPTDRRPPLVARTPRAADAITTYSGAPEMGEWWAKEVSNLRPPACKAGALPLSYSPCRDGARQMTGGRNRCPV